MLKRCLSLLIACAVIGGSVMPLALAEEQAEQPVDFTPNARSAILMDADSGTVIYEKNADEQLPPASITKVMTMLLVMEALDEGTLKLDDKIRTSEYAASMGGSQIFLEVGEEMTLQDMLKGIALASGNDASVAVAERIAGSEEGFVKMMNDRAGELGMSNSHFVNANGLPAENHYTTARDIAVMSRELLKHEEITAYTGLYQDYLRKDSDKPFWLVNTNKLVRFYPGADGLKTGYTGEAKFCLAATAKRDNFRVVSVVLGEPDTKTRNAEISKLFDYAFSQYTNQIVVNDGDVLGEVRVSRGKPERFQLTANRRYSVLLKKAEASADIRYQLELAPELKAPVEAGQIIGKIIVYKGEEQLTEFPLEAPAAVPAAGWWDMLKRTVGHLFST